MVTRVVGGGVAVYLVIGTHSPLVGQVGDVVVFYVYTVNVHTILARLAPVVGAGCYFFTPAPTPAPTAGADYRRQSSEYDLRYTIWVYNIKAATRYTRLTPWLKLKP